MKIVARYLMVLILLMAGIRGNSQNENQKWYFGSSCGLDFSSNPPIVLNNGQINTFARSSSVSDNNGGLLFYTDANIVYNSSHQIMSNGAGMIGQSITQPVISIKKPGSQSIYYIVTVSSNGMFYSTVDMNLSAGMGSVTVKNATITNLNATGITASPHCNGSDIWIISHVENTSIFNAFLVTSAGINTVAVSSNVGPPLDGATIKVSPQGTKLGVASMNTLQNLIIYDFNANTGQISNAVPISQIPSLISLEFSPDGSKVYSTRSGAQNVWQWDLCAGTGSAIAASVYSVAGFIGGVPKRYMQLAPNGKIYISRPGTNLLSVINDPNVSGAGCNFVEQGQIISQMSSGIPNMMNYSMRERPQSYSFSPNFQGDCRTVAFTAPPTPTFGCISTVTNTGWCFDDPLSGALNTSTLSNPVHVYSGPGIYNPYFVFYYNCGTDTVRQQVTIAGPSLSVLGLPATCSVQGSASVAATGGSGNFTYTWSPGLQNSAIVTNLNPGGYTVSVFDVGAGCTVTDSVIIGSNYVFTGSVTSLDVSCNASNTGSAEIVVAGGTGNYIYNWNTGANTSSILNLSAGIYSVMVSDQNSPCSLTQTVQITEPAALNLNIVPSATAMCVGGNITLQSFISGGVPTYGFSWSNGAASATNTIAESVPGNYVYTLTVTDVNNCSIANTIPLTFLQSPVLNVLSSTICVGYSGTLSVTGANSYTWYPGGVINSVFISNPGSTSEYTVIASSSDCNANSVGRGTISVVQPPQLNVNLSSNTLCAQAFNGSPNTITLTAGGASSYTLNTPAHILNSNPSGPSMPLGSAPPYTNLVSIATATLFGSNGVCTVSTTVSFSVIPNPTLSILNPTPVICAGQSFTYHSAGANSFTWGPNTPGLTTYTSPVTVASPTVTSVYSVIGGSLGCNSPTETTTITVNPIPTIFVTPNQTAVCIGNSATLKISGTANSFTWMPFLYLNDKNGEEVIATPQTNITYTVTGSLNNCTNTAMASVDVLPLPTPKMKTSKSELCAGETLTLTGSGGELYKWYGPNNVYLEGQSVSLNLGSYHYAGQYSLVATDSNACVNSTLTNIVIYPLPEGSLIGSQMEACVHFCSDFRFYSASNSASLITASWELNKKKFASDFSYCFDKAGDHIVTGKFKDGNTGCLNTQTFVIHARPKPQADFTWLPEKPIENLDEVLFYNNTPGENQTNWNWYFTDNKGYRSQNENTSYLFKNAGLYPVAYIVKNNFGCVDSVVKIVTIEPDFSVYVPNTFTPNDDDLNERFLPIVRGIKQYSFAIFNRWGEKLFETTDPKSGWDGYHNGVNCKTDVYVWVIRLTTVHGASKEYKGHVSLLR